MSCLIWASNAARSDWNFEFDGVGEERCGVNDDGCENGVAAANGGVGLEKSPGPGDAEAEGEKDVSIVV